MKLHAEQLSDQGGAALARGPLPGTELRPSGMVLSPRRHCRRWPQAGTVAVLLARVPSTFCVKPSCRLLQALRDAGVPMAIASDHNPGSSSPGLSLLLMLNMACTLFRMTPARSACAACHRQRRACAGPARPRHNWWPANRPTSASAMAPTSCELAACFGHNPLIELAYRGTQARGMSAAPGRPKQGRSRLAGVSPGMECSVGIPCLENAWPICRPGTAAGPRVHP